MTTHVFKYHKHLPHSVYLIFLRITMFSRNAVQLRITLIPHSLSFGKIHKLSLRICHILEVK